MTIVFAPFGRLLNLGANKCNEVAGKTLPDPVTNVTKWQKGGGESVD